MRDTSQFLGVGRRAWRPLSRTLHVQSGLKSVCGSVRTERREERERHGQQPPPLALAIQDPPANQKIRRLPPVAAGSRAAAQRHCTILITGETGVGKGHLANHIHRYSPRANQPFVPINCGAIPESLMDSQLFGHAKGAFSDARREHPGMIRAARWNHFS